MSRSWKDLFSGNPFKYNEETGRFSIQMIVWNLLWFIPLYAAMLLLCTFVAVAHFSVDEGIEVWNRL